MPNQFYALKPYEFLEMWDGYLWRKENEEDRLAYFTAAAMSVHTKNPVLPKDLLEPLRENVKQQTKKEDEEYLKEIFDLPGGG